ncbi:hypothetical protein EOD41_01995 [Mucilaginibacter limnophilus]|uniref:Uncharacterized protein n=1 Tax=Mucilaginibacter limnophilus TaxID=1932778 RepID=A0A437MYJ1_9SPHI|nr:hypothetical protein [Mucilaginibacter limnophilus]RVU02734.1 hypothetical protein EOD41_01995 [Mucilaginibacter limnophilus]
MKPININIGTDLHLLVVPDSEAHMDGHPVLTYIYDIFRVEGNVPGHTIIENNLIAAQKQTNPNYMGHITFEQPGKLFTYTAEEGNALTSGEVEQVIEEISHFRDTPRLWAI